ncbi:unnamed protein product [Effrenium voratum]|nr:unnamed protein product [Effrenium voratum]
MHPGVTRPWWKSTMRGEVKSWQVLDKNAVSGYAFCDLVQGVLRQNADQAGTATCGPTAVLAALTQVNPAGAIKRGLEIFWTGTIPELPADAQPCEYLYSEVPPGVIPFLPGQPGTEGSAGRALLLPCLGNEADCEQAVDAPNTQAGLQGMWSLMFGSASDRRKTGGCSENYWYVRYPGRDPRENALVRMETSVADIMTLCDTVLGERGTCKYLTNYDLCDKVKLEDKEQCRRFHTIPGLTPQDMNAFELYEKHGAVPAPFGEIFQQSMAPGGRIHSFLAGVTALGLGAGELIAAVTMSSLSESVTEQLRSNPRGSLLFVYAGGLPASAPEEGHPFDGPGNPEYSACNHWVYAEGCNFGPEKDAVSIWTWGYRMYVTKNFLMTSNGGHPLVCGSILVP